jgi:hypothetical protein
MASILSPAMATAPPGITDLSWAGTTCPARTIVLTSVILRFLLEHEWLLERLVEKRSAIGSFAMLLQIVITPQPVYSKRSNILKDLGSICLPQFHMQNQNKPGSLEQKNLVDSNGSKSYNNNTFKIT